MSSNAELVNESLRKYIELLQKDISKLEQKLIKYEESCVVFQEELVNLFGITHLEKDEDPKEIFLNKVYELIELRKQICEMCSIDPEAFNNDWSLLWEIKRHIII